jgi:hypothetical protein
MALSRVLVAAAAACVTQGAVQFRRRGDVTFARYARDAVSQSSIPPALDAPQGGLKGALGFITFAEGSFALELDAWNLSTNTSNVLYEFPNDYLESGYVEGSTIVNNTWYLSLQYDSDEKQGVLVTYDIAHKKLLSTFNTTFCYGLWANPLVKGEMLCLALDLLPNGTQATFLHKIELASHKDTIVGTYLPGYAPYTVDALDVKRGIIVNSAAPLNGGGDNVLNLIDITTGKQIGVTSYPEYRAFIELDYDVVSGDVYSVVDDIVNTDRVTYFGTVDIATAAGTPVGNANFSYFGQLNTISTVAPEIGTFFSTAFHYVQPTEPVLYLVGNDLRTGAFNYMSVIRNPFCDIEWDQASALAQAAAQEALAEAKRQLRGQ